MSFALGQAALPLNDWIREPRKADLPLRQSVQNSASFS
jgi:hypothetical protein